MDARPPPCFMHMERYATWHVTWSDGIGVVNLCDECALAVRDLIEKLEPLPKPTEAR